MTQDNQISSNTQATLAANSAVRSAERVVVLTGAGISTDSGIPDFRGPNGVWTKNPKAERLSSIEQYLGDSEVRISAWKGRLDHRSWGAVPNAGHNAIRELEKHKKLFLLITQNIDGLHHDSGVDPQRIVEIHGTLRDVVCMDCEAREEAGPTLERVRLGEQDPHCLICGDGILKSATISFGQSLAAEDIDRSFAAAAMCDLFIAVGTNLSVYPIASTVPIAAKAGAKIIIVNGTPTDMDELADIVIHDSISDVLPAIFRAD